MWLVGLAKVAGLYLPRLVRLIPAQNTCTNYANVIQLVVYAIS